MTDTSTALVTFDDAKKIAAAGVAEALAYVQIATDFKIENQEDAQLAADQLSGLSKFGKAHEATRLSLTNPYRDMGIRIKAEFDVALDKAGEAEKLLRAELTRWTEEQAENARLERARLEKIAADERADAAKKLADELARAEKLKTPEAQAKAADRIEVAAARVENAELTAVVVQAPSKVKGFGLRDNWQPVYGDIHELIKAAAANPKLAIYLDWNATQITSVVKALKANTDIPGVAARNNKTSAVR